jgi:dTDP-4-amino-4,6-dideoxygalactose transaminase
MIPFNKPFIDGHELSALTNVINSGHLAGDGIYTRKASEFFEKRYGTKRALLTHSCTAALEMSALLLDLSFGDEVIVPSYTFVSSASAFVLAGAKIVFVDIRKDTLNINEIKIEEAITKRTKAIVVVHYAGVACEMDYILSIADKYGISVIEDAAQAIHAKYKGRPLGTLSRFGTLSFHETKNVISGEGGALFIKSKEDAFRAEVIREKGTDRSSFLRGEIDKYSWKELGSSYLLSELLF